MGFGQECMLKPSLVVVVPDDTPFSYSFLELDSTYPVHDDVDSEVESDGNPGDGGVAN